MDIWVTGKKIAHVGVKVAVGIGGTVLTGLLMKAADNYVDEQVDNFKAALGKKGETDERREEESSK